MNQIILNLQDKTELLYFIENLAEAQKCIVEAKQVSGHSEEKDFAQTAIANIIAEVAKQYAGQESISEQLKQVL